MPPATAVPGTWAWATPNTSTPGSLGERPDTCPASHLHLWRCLIAVYFRDRAQRLPIRPALPSRLAIIWQALCRTAITAGFHPPAELLLCRYIYFPFGCSWALQAVPVAGMNENPAYIVYDMGYRITVNDTSHTCESIARPASCNPQAASWCRGAVSTAGLLYDMMAHVAAPVAEVQWRRAPRHRSLASFQHTSSPRRSAWRERSGHFLPRPGGQLQHCVRRTGVFHAGVLHRQHRPQHVLQYGEGSAYRGARPGPARALLR